jgi:hypothetical protein
VSKTFVRALNSGDIETLRFLIQLAKDNPEVAVVIGTLLLAQGAKMVRDADSMPAQPFPSPQPKSEPKTSSLPSLPTGTVAAAAAAAKIAVWWYGGTQVNPTNETPSGGAKSADQYKKHMEKLRAAKKQLQELQEELNRATGQKKRAQIREAIDELEKSIKGHEKEVRQKWPNGPPTE